MYVQAYGPQTVSLECSRLCSRVVRIIVTHTHTMCVFGGVATNERFGGVASPIQPLESHEVALFSPQSVSPVDSEIETRRPVLTKVNPLYLRLIIPRMKQRQMKWQNTIQSYSRDAQLYYGTY